MLFALEGCWYWIAAALLIWTGSIWIPVQRKRYWKAGIISLLFLIVFAGSMIHTRQLEDRTERIRGQLTEGETVTVEGKVYKIEYKNERYRIYLKHQGDTVICYYDSDRIEIGDRIRVTGDVYLFDRATNEGQFDVRAFYEAQRIYYALNSCQEEVIDRSRIPLADRLYRLRCRLEESLTAACKKGEQMGIYFLTEERAGVLASMLLGDRGLLEENLQSLYQAAGISHILAISALHISLIGMGFYHFLRKRRWGFLTAALAAGPLIFAYVTMTGLSVSARRAEGMLFGILIGAVLGRSRDLVNSLGLVTGLLLWENPFLIHYSGLLFSAAAVMGIGVTGVVFGQGEEEKTGCNKISCFIKTIGYRLKSNLMMSLAISLTTLPLVAYYYYEIPLYSVFLNLLVLPLMSLLLISGILGTAAGLIGSFPGALCLIPAGLILKWYEDISSFFLQLPGAVLICGQPSELRVIIYYSVLGMGLLLLYFLKQWEEDRVLTEEGRENLDGEPGKPEGQGREKAARRLRRRRALVKAGLTFACMALMLTHQKKGFELDQLDVGQGDGAFIRTDDGVNLFVDGGSTSVDGLAEYRLLPFLKYKGVKAIDYWIISHGDEDHISGFLEVLESGYSVKNVVIAKEMPEDEARQQIEEAAEAAGSRLLLVKAGDMIRTETAVISFLYPDTGDSSLFTDRNDLSLTFLLEEDGIRALFTGDLSSEGEAMLMDRWADLSVDYLKICHHGSRYSSCEEFLARTDPAVSVISCGLVNSYGHPSQEAVSRIMDSGSLICYTMYSGEVRLEKKKGKLEVFFTGTGQEPAG